MVLPMLYAISLLYTLNLRNEIRNERTTSQNPSSATHPNHTYGGPGGGGKRSFLPGDPSSRSTGDRGVSFIGGNGASRGRGYSSGGVGGGGNVQSPHTRSFSKKLDGIHVETHISTHGGSSGNNVELDTFDGVKASANNSDFEREVWETDRKYMAQ
ncbi:hypothetical protein FRC17_004627 [Serendipita sp. 399]|nr:hypothetical protein FRC17_004627 [Serendipita sp. 399]